MKFYLKSRSFHSRKHIFKMPSAIYPPLCACLKVLIYICISLASQCDKLIKFDIFFLPSSSSLTNSLLGLFCVADLCMYLAISLPQLGMQLINLVLCLDELVSGLTETRVIVRLQQENGFIIWVGSWRCGCLVAWFCYQMIAKPGTVDSRYLASVGSQNSWARVKWFSRYLALSREGPNSRLARSQSHILTSAPLKPKQYVER